MKEIEVPVKAPEIFERDNSLSLTCIKASTKKLKFDKGSSGKDLIIPSDRNLGKIRKRSVGTMRSHREGSIACQGQEVSGVTRFCNRERGDENLQSPE